MRFHFHNTSVSNIVAKEVIPLQVKYSLPFYVFINQLRIAKEEREEDSVSLLKK